MTDATIHPCMDSRKSSAQKSTPDKSVLIARGRIKHGRKSIARRGWDTLPQGRRGQRILAWFACMAWDGYPSNPEAAVRRICGGLAPYLKEAEWIDLIAKTKVANRRFNHDQCAVVLEISVIDCLAHGSQFLGADNDPDYRERHKAKKARNAACQRRRRAANGAVPRALYEANSLSRTKPWEAEGISRSTYDRRRKKAAAQAGADDQSPSPDKIRITGQVTHFRHEASMRGEPKATPRQNEIGDSRDAPEARPASKPPQPIVIRLDAVPDGLILDEDGNELKIPPPYERPTVPKTWREAAFQGYRGDRS